MKTLFSRIVLLLLRHIPPGRVTSYAALTKAFPGKNPVRAVATAVGKNPFPPLFPCHRVVRSGGKVGQYSGHGGIPEKIRLLEKEGVIVKEEHVVDFSEIFFDPFLLFPKPWFVYMLRCRDDSLYTGIATDLQRRIQEHHGSSRGARYTRSRTPCSLVWFDVCASRSEATKKEQEWKKMSREQKEMLLQERGFFEKGAKNNCQTS